MDPSQHEKWNDDMARKYNPDAFITKSGFFIRWVESKRLQKTRDFLRCGPEDTLLDLGCGPGNLLEKLEGGRLVGLDLSDYLLGQAKERLKNKPHVELVKGYGEDLLFPDNTFSRVVCSEVLEHVKDPKKVISEIHRVAKPGARVVITVPNESLINFTKRVVLALGLKKFISGQYQMSDNMLEEWHQGEITRKQIFEACREGFSIYGKGGIPWPFFAYHHITAFTVNKK